MHFVANFVPTVVVFDMFATQLAMACDEVLAFVIKVERLHEVVHIAHLRFTGYEIATVVRII